MTMEGIRNVASAMALFGVPSLCALATYFVKACIKFSKKIDILMNAQQKQMRRELQMDFHTYMDAGHIDDEDLDMWEASYQAYHALGKNGIMDNYRQKLIELNAKGNKNAE
jgi:hypothetical protein